MLDYLVYFLTNGGSAASKLKLRRHYIILDFAVEGMLIQSNVMSGKIFFRPFHWLIWRTWLKIRAHVVFTVVIKTTAVMEALH